MELASATKFNLDISSETEVLFWQYTGDDPLEVVARVDLGGGSGLLSGVGGQYEMRFFIDDNLITPISIIDVPPGRQTTIMVARPVPIRAQDQISLRIVGLAGDTSVNTQATLRDSTPAKAGDFIGTGSVEVDQDYGGTEELAYKTDEGIGVDNAQLRIYLQTDYDQGLTDSSHIVAATLTDVNGHWVKPLMLDPETYVLYAYKQGYYGPDTKVFTVG
jgi:hypothetical protein